MNYLKNRKNKSYYKVLFVPKIVTNKYQPGKQKWSWPSLNSNLSACNKHTCIPNWLETTKFKNFIGYNSCIYLSHIHWSWMVLHLLSKCYKQKLCREQKSLLPVHNKGWTSGPWWCSIVTLWLQYVPNGTYRFYSV